MVYGCTGIHSGSAFPSNIYKIFVGSTPILNTKIYFGDIAQLVERWPAQSTIFKNKYEVESIENQNRPKTFADGIFFKNCSFSW